jgi:hypothetical protein
VLGCVPLLALLNVFGQRPDTSRVATKAAILSVYSPSRVRGGLMFTTRIHVTARKELKRAALILDPGWVEGMQVNSIDPQPVTEGSDNGRIVLGLGHIPAGQSTITFIEFQVDPTNVGHRSQDVVLTDNSKPIATLHRTITIFP